MRLLRLVFKHYDAWAQQRAYVCQPGCSSCCTAKVTMTELEGELILSHCRSHGVSLHNFTATQDSPAWRPGLTANQFASCCLRDAWPEQEEEAEYPAAQCGFLNTAAQCSIYAVRPLACRVMASSLDCRREGCAEVPTVHITLSAALAQLIEHLDQGNAWGNLVDILNYLHLRKEERDEFRKTRLLVCGNSPGWLVPDDERNEIVPFLQSIFAVRLDGRSMSDILGLGFF